MYVVYIMYVILNTIQFWNKNLSIAKINFLYLRAEKCEYVKSKEIRKLFDSV